MASAGPVVVNSGPVIGLSLVGQLELLGKLYEQVLVPDAVYREVVEEGAGKPGADQLERANWIQRVRLQSAPDRLIDRAIREAGE